MSTFQKVQKTCLRPRVPRLMSLAPLGGDPSEVRGRGAQGTWSLASKILRWHVSFAPYQHTTVFFFFLLLNLERASTVKAEVKGMCVMLTRLYFWVWSLVLKDWCVLALSSRLYTACLESKGVQSIFIYGSALLKAVTQESWGVRVYISHILVYYVLFAIQVWRGRCIISSEIYYLMLLPRILARKCCTLFFFQ